MTFLERLEKFSDKFGFKIIDTSMIDILEADEQVFGATICPCIFVNPHIGEKEILKTVIEHRCPCDSVLSLKSGESCHCGMLEKI